MEALPQGWYLLVVDGLVQRRPWPGGAPPGDLLVRLRNPRGALSLESVSAICRLLEEAPEKRIVVEVDGEEDMVAVAAASCSPWPVVYGLPGVGSVLLRPAGYARSRASLALLALRPGLVSGL